MSDFKLESEVRTEKTKQVRNSGKIPAVVYGSDYKNKSIAIDEKTFNRIFNEAGTSNLIDLKIGDERSVKTLVHDYQLDPMTRRFLHVDFFKVNMKEKITAEVPLKFVGESAAVINLDGSLITPVDAIEIECLPADLPSEIEVDVTALDAFDKNIKISDLTIPAGVTVMAEPEEIVAFVQEPRSEEELEALNEEIVEDVEAVEVENKGEEAPAEGEETAPKSE